MVEAAFRCDRGGLLRFRGDMGLVAGVADDGFSVFAAIAGLISSGAELALNDTGFGAFD